MNSRYSSSILAWRRTQWAVAGFLVAQFICPPTKTFSQEALLARPYAVEVSASIPAGTPLRIRLSWPSAQDTTGTYYIYRKAKTSTAWGNVFATRAGTETFYE